MKRLLSVLALLFATLFSWGQNNGYGWPMDIQSVPNDVAEL